MQKLVNSGKSAMDKIMEGVNLIANPVVSTLSPNGRTVIISKAHMSDYQLNDYPLQVTKDGYNVGMSISSSDREVQVGVLFIQQALSKQMLDCGDATTTTALLVKYILEGGLKLIEEGVSHVEVKNGIMKAVDLVVERLKEMSTPIAGNAELIRQVATVSANGDQQIGDLIAEAFAQIGDDGIIDIEPAKNIETKIVISSGIKFHKGYSSQYFITDKSKSVCILENPYILIYDRPITKMVDNEGGTGIMPILEKILKQEQASGIKRPLMIFCDAADSEALATLTFNTQQGRLQSCVVEMQFLGDKKRVFLEDIAAATGGFFVNELKGTKLSNIGLEHLGQAEKIVVTKDETIIMGGRKKEDEFNSLVNDIKALEQKEEDTTAKDLLKKRLARLTGSVATLLIGGTTEVEMNERFDRADDAVRATASAVEEGFVPGSGTSLLECRMVLADFIKANKEHAKGADVIYQSLYKPLEQICINAGVSYIDKIDFLSSPKGIGLGYNAKSDAIEDLVKAGIIEPTKSNRCALQNAASVVCAILTSQYMVTDCL